MSYGRRGFTLVETMFAVALFAFAIAVVGPLLTRIARHSTLITQSQRRTAAVVTSSSRTAAQPYAGLASGCVVDMSTGFGMNACATVTDILPNLRRIDLVVQPLDPAFPTADTVLLYKSNATSSNPFNYP